MNLNGSDPSPDKSDSRQLSLDTLCELIPETTRNRKRSASVSTPNPRGARPYRQFTLCVLHIVQWDLLTAPDLLL